LVRNFKNHAEYSLSFSSRINCIIGNNGVGKTNLLDAIHFLSLCKSYFMSNDAALIKHGQDFFYIKGVFDDHGNEMTIEASLKLGGRKQFKVNNNICERLSDHIGSIPQVMITPMDTSLIYEGSEERRRLLDMTLSQTNKEYLHSLSQYNRYVDQRNKYLKSLQPHQPVDNTLMETLNAQLVRYGTYIFNLRQQFIHEITPSLETIYSFLSLQKEHVKIIYKSQLLNDSLKDLLIQHQHSDQITCRTNYGTHKDDIEFMLNDYSLRKFGSQGQQKVFIFALKMALLEYLTASKHTTPILLLDDVFEKLDKERSHRLLELAGSNRFGQIFITDTHAERAKPVLQALDPATCFFEL
jgi:DNA replication and repair protein RecF